jgi:L-asparaginase II
MLSQYYLPVLEITRGVSLTDEQTLESIHFGAITAVDVKGQLFAWYGDPNAVTFLRSSAKPFQALPFLERGGHTAFNLSLREIALICASHSGTDEHARVARSIQEKAHVKETDLLCGVHSPMHEPTAESLRQRGEQPSPNRHNCSGKHSGMLAFARLENLPIENYIDPEHPIQKIILQTFAEMCGLPVEDVKIGTDGCSAPNFAVPLYNAALGFAHLCDPESGNILPKARADACRVITKAMTTNPDMVGGSGRFDTQLMEIAGGRILSKGGAEGFQGMGLLPGALGPGSPAIGIAIKVADGDLKGRAVPAVSLEVLRQLGVLSPEELAALANYGPVTQITNWRKLVVGESMPCFKLQTGSRPHYASS